MRYLPKHRSGNHHFEHYSVPALRMRARTDSRMPPPLLSLPGCQPGSHVFASTFLRALVVI